MARPALIQYRSLLPLKGAEKMSSVCALHATIIVKYELCYVKM